MAPRRSASGGLSSAIRTVWVRVTGSAWGETSRTWPTAVMSGAPARVTSITGSFGRRPDAGLGDVEHGLPLLRLGDPHHNSAGLDHLSGIGADGGHDAVPVRRQLGVADPVARRPQGGLGGHDPGVRRALGQ